MKEYCVYIHKCPNNKVYIGITCQVPQKRWMKGNGYKHNKHFFRAIQKYEWENIEHIILFKKLTKEEAEQKEIELIKQYKSNISKYGYNIESGGNSKGKHNKKTLEKISKANKGKKLSEETKKKISVAQKGKYHTEETKEKMSKTRKGRKLTKEHKQKLSRAKIGENNQNYGKHLSKEQKEKISKSLKGHKSWNKNLKMKPRSEMSKKKISKPVICIETGIVYYGMREAERQTGISHTYIYYCCQQNNRMIKGYHWRYYNE